MTARISVRLGGAALAALTLTAVTACGASTKSPTPPTPTGTTPVGTPSATPLTATPTPTPTAPTSPTPAAMRTCTDNIRVIPGQTNGAAGHLALTLVFNNVSTTPCRMLGYPGVALVNASGATVANAARTLRGMAGGLPAGAVGPSYVVLAPGHSASALVEASDVPQGNIKDCGSFSLIVTVPEQTVAVPAGTATMPRCDLQVHPVVAGTSGGKG